MKNGSKRSNGMRSSPGGRLDLSSPAAVAEFRAAAKAYTQEATKSKQAAIATLHREGILTKSGKFTKPYSVKD